MLTTLPDSAVSIVLSYDMAKQTCYRVCDEMFTNNSKFQHPWWVVEMRVKAIQNVLLVKTFDLAFVFQVTIDLCEITDLAEIVKIDAEIKHEITRIPKKAEIKRIPPDYIHQP